MPARETAGEDQETVSDDYGYELNRIFKRIGALQDELDLRGKQLDHIDEMLHGLVAFVDQHRPLLDRFTKWAGAGRGWRAWQNGTAPKKPGP